MAANTPLQGRDSKKARMYGSLGHQPALDPDPCQHDDDDDDSDVVYPSFWTSMNKKTVMGVNLDLKSEEAKRVTRLFHEPKRMKIRRILRIQNPRVWAHYYRKREQMRRERGGKRVLEYRLFHGTAVRNVDSICRKSFEVGRLGKNLGYAYGRGIYFATLSSISHRYATCGTYDLYPKIFTTPLLSSACMDTREFKDIDYKQGWSAANPLLASLEGSNCEGELMHFDQQQGAAYQSVGEECGSNEGKEQGNPDANFQLPVLTQHLVRPLVTRRSTPKTFTKTTACLTNTAVATDPVIPAKSARRDPEASRTRAFTSSRVARQDTVVTIGGGDAPRSSAPSTVAAAQEKKIDRCQHYMFLSSVLVGSTAPGRHRYVMPPLMDPSQPDSRRHDSCYNCSGDCLQFVVFRNNQVYPEYLIEYSHRCQSALSRYKTVLKLMLVVACICVFLIVRVLQS